MFLLCVGGGGKGVPPDCGIPSRKRQSLGFRVEGLGLRVQGLGFRV